MKISIITVSYNTAKYIERAINSVLLQDYDNWEHIIIDGGSRDGTTEILKKFRHLLWISEPDSGQSDAMNKGFNISTGDAIIYLNADDELNPGLFSTVAEYFKKNVNTDLLVMDLESIKNHESTVTSPSTSLYEILRCESPKFPLNPISYAYRRELQVKIGPFPVDNHYAMDYWFLLHAYLFGNVRKVNFIGGKFYFDGINKSNNWNQSLQHLKKVRDRFLVKYFFEKPVFLFNLKFIRIKVHYLWLYLKRLLFKYSVLL
jgi:glycosyltransferase involved in cell wall biosynthesis